MNIKPDRVIKIKNNGILIESSSKEVEKLLEETVVNTPKLKVRRPKPIWPKVVVYNVDEKIQSEEVLNLIEKGLEDEEIPSNWCNFIGKIGPRRAKLTNWKLELHPKVWKSGVSLFGMGILQGGRSYKDIAVF